MDKKSSPKIISPQDIENMILEIVGAHFGLPAITLSVSNSITKDIGADSLDRVELIMTVEELFGVKIDDKINSEIDTIGDIVEAILKTSPSPSNLDLAKQTWAMISKGRYST